MSKLLILLLAALLFACAFVGAKTEDDDDDDGDPMKNPMKPMNPMDPMKPMGDDDVDDKWDWFRKYLYELWKRHLKNKECKKCKSRLDRVCGTDGESYPNECYLKRENCLNDRDGDDIVEVACAGKCPCPDPDGGGDNSTTTPEECTFMEKCDGWPLDPDFVPMECADNEYCEEMSDDDICPTTYTGMCRERKGDRCDLLETAGCDEDFESYVCGSDGTSFKNDCLRYKRNCENGVKQEDDEWIRRKCFGKCPCEPCTLARVVDGDECVADESANTTSTGCEEEDWVCGATVCLDGDDCPDCFGYCEPPDAKGAVDDPAASDKVSVKLRVFLKDCTNLAPLLEYISEFMDSAIKVEDTVGCSSFKRNSGEAHVDVSLSNEENAAVSAVVASLNRDGSGLGVTHATTATTSSSSVLAFTLFLVIALIALVI